MNERYIVERQFNHKGYECVVVLQRAGHRCGYVGIPAEHPLYGKKYDDYLEIKKSDMIDRKVSGIFPLLGACLDEDERIRIEAYFQCHGGITYFGGGENSKYPIKSNLWWFGFDCGHAGDKPDFDAVFSKFTGDMKSVILLKKISDEFPIDGEVVRSEQYVADECKKLAEQLKEFEESEE